MKRNILATIAILILFTPKNFAQHNIGVATSDYSALNSLYLNPANIAGCKEKISISVFSLNAAVDNNLGTFSSISNLGNTNSFNTSGNNTFSALAPAVDIHLPGILIGLNDALQQSFAFTTRIRGMNQLNNFSDQLYNTVSNSNRSNNQNNTYQAQNFNWTANVWSEAALTYALVPYDDGTNQLKVGVTLRYLGGIDYLSIKGKNLDVSLPTGGDTFYASHSDIEFASNVINSSDAYSNGITASDVLGQFFGSKAGGGFGMDIGASYSYYLGGSKDDPDSHRLRAAAAVTDIGAITYKAQNNFVANITGNGYLTSSGLSQNTSNFSDLKSYAVGQGFTVDTGKQAAKVYMPTAMNLNVDYQLYQRFYVNALFLLNLANRDNYGNSYYDQFSITPRYDSKIFSVGLPITYSALAHDMKVGVGIRFGGFFIGSDDMLALLSNNQHGFNAYMGGTIPIYKKKKRDIYNPPNNL